MYNKYNNLLIFSFFLEKMPTMFWTNKTLSPKHTILYVPNRWFFLLTQILKNEVTLSNNFLVENSGLDITNTNQFYFKNYYLNFFKITSFYTFYLYFLKTKITLFIGNTNQTSSTYTSIDTIYSNANWLERETSEMYSINYTFKSDVRRLLLDYSKIENPLLKKFPCEGYNDLFYSIFENQVVIKQSETIEL